MQPGRGGSAGEKVSGIAAKMKASLRTKIIVWFFVPTAIILIAVALVNFYAYQTVTQDLVIERDQDLTRLSAGQLSTELRGFTNLLSDVSRLAEGSQKDNAPYQDALSTASKRLVVFDGGVVILNNFGAVVAADPARPEIMGQDWSDRAYFRQMVRSPNPIFSNVVADGPQGAPVVAVAVPMIGRQGEILGSVVGMFRLGASSVSAFYGTIVKLRIGGKGTAFVVDSNGQVIHHWNSDLVGSDFSGVPVVQRVMAGQVGAIRTGSPDGEIIAGFAPVPGTPWGLVREESWDALVGGSVGYQRLLIVLLALGALVPAGIAALGTRQVMRPMDDLIKAAREMARGNFGQTIVTRSGDEIEDLAREFNLMAAKLQESHLHLEQRVADRTRELRESEERLRTVITSARIVLFALDRQGIFTLSEGSGLDALGLKPGEAVGSSVRDLYRDVPEIVADVDRALSGEDVTASVEVGDLAFETRYSPLRGAGGAITGVIGVSTDVTDRKRAEAARMRAEEKYRSIFENAVEGIYQSTPGGQLLTSNPAMAKMLGYGSPAELQQAITDIAAQSYVDPARREEFTRLLDAHGVLSAFEFQVYRNDGEIIWVSENARAVRDESGGVLYYEGTIEEVTERKRAEERLRELATLQERQRLARDLHDAVTQTLFSASLIGEVLPRLWERSPDEGRRRLEELRQLTRGALAEMRTLLLELRPAALTEAPLGDLLRQLAEATTGRARVPVTLDIECSTSLPPDVQVTLYRIAQESLNNVTKHSAASQATVNLRCTAKEVDLCICDNGRGFDPGSVSAEHLGLGIMQERARAIGARITVESRPGCGTQVRLVWSIPNDKEQP